MPDNSPATSADARIRAADLQDLAALVALEGAAFTRDRLSRRQLRYLLSRARARILVAERRGTPVGYVILLFRRDSAWARVYSIAIAAAARGRGLGSALLAAAEAAVHDAGRCGLRLEVRRDNAGAIALYRARGFRQFAVVGDYYEDGQDALRFEKTLAGEPHEPSG
ncbi:MAG: GNAT family N-acetyltransferase [Gammaproteobacteria bacterium]